MIDAFIESWNQRISALGINARADDHGYPIRADFSSSAPLLISHSLDKTAEYFFRTCASKKVHLNWIQADRLSTGILLDDALHLISHSCGIYAREFSEGKANRLACAAIRSLLLKHDNVVAPNLRSSNWCKPIHIKRLESYVRGFRTVHVPETWLATSSPATCRLVVKNVSSSPAYVFDVPSQASECEDGLPHLFQHRISGYELRVHVIDRLCIAVAFRALGVDYRRDGCSAMRKATLTPEQYQACIHISSSEGLRFCGIDMIVDGSDSYIIEANPMPGYHGFERDGLQDTLITDALYQALVESGGAAPATLKRA